MPAYQASKYTPFGRAKEERREVGEEVRHQRAVQQLRASRGQPSLDALTSAPASHFKAVVGFTEGDPSAVGRRYALEELAQGTWRQEDLRSTPGGLSPCLSMGSSIPQFIADWVYLFHPGSGHPDTRLSREAAVRAFEEWAKARQLQDVDFPSEGEWLRVGNILADLGGEQ